MGHVPSCDIGVIELLHVLSSEPDSQQETCNINCCQGSQDLKSETTHYKPGNGYSQVSQDRLTDIWSSLVPQFPANQVRWTRCALYKCCKCYPWLSYYGMLGGRVEEQHFVVISAQDRRGLCSLTPVKCRRYPLNRGLGGLVAAAVTKMPSNLDRNIIF